MPNPGLRFTEPPIPNVSEEQTRAQNPEVSTSTMLPGFDLDRVSSYKLYREMRSDPTIALARAVATSPIRASWKNLIIQVDEGFEKEGELVEEMFLPMKDWLVNNSLFALDYGWAPFEKVWEAKEGKIWLTKLKPLFVDKTEILIDLHGHFQGLEQSVDGVKLEVPYTFVYSYDVEAGNFYGRSRMENCKRAFLRSREIDKKYEQFLRKVSSIIPWLEYPDEHGKDETGRDISGYQMAKNVLDRLAEGKGVAVPNNLLKYAEDAIRAGVDPSKLKKWFFHFIEASSGHAQEFIEPAKMLDAKMMRGWLVPERAATEGQHGTKAESEAHAAISLVTAEEVSIDVADFVNLYIINHITWLNFGTMNGVRAVPPPIVDETRQILKGLVERIFNPTNVDSLFTNYLDADAVFDSLGLPKVAETLSEEVGMLDRIKGLVTVE